MFSGVLPRKIESGSLDHLRRVDAGQYRLRKVAQWEGARGAIRQHVEWYSTVSHPSPDPAFFLLEKTRTCSPSFAGSADDRIEFPGECNTKTGADPSKWDAEYTEHLARSFEAQTYVYESSAVGVVSGLSFGIEEPWNAESRALRDDSLGGSCGPGRRNKLPIGLSRL